MGSMVLMLFLIGSLLSQNARADLPDTLPGRFYDNQIITSVEITPAFGFLSASRFPESANSSYPAGANRESVRDFEEALDDGISAFYRADWEQARSDFEKLRSRDESDPRPWFFEAMLPFWRYFFAGQHPEAAEQFLDKSEDAIGVGKNRMKAAPDDTTTVLLLGGLYGYRGLVAAGEQQYRTALQSGAAGFSYTRTLMGMDGEHLDALIGQGVFHYMMGTIPREARWLTSLAGLRGDKATGLQKLEEAAASDIHTSTDARMILTYLYHRENKYEEALRVVGTLVEKWPENVIFRYYYGLSLEKTGQLHEAEQAYRMVVERDHPELNELTVMVQSRLDNLGMMDRK